jgi:hypothetical protein
LLKIGAISSVIHPRRRCAIARKQQLDFLDALRIDAGDLNAHEIAGYRRAPRNQQPILAALPQA